MKVCYIAPYRDGTGYSKAALEYILALDSVGVQVVPRPVKMTDTSGEIPHRIIELENNNLQNIDAVVQHNLPSEFAYKGGILNIGAFAYETNQFPNTTWVQNIELMDKIVVFCRHQVVAMENTIGRTGRLAKKTVVIPHAVDISKFDKEQETMDFGVPKNTVKFYTIGEFVRRKSIPGLIAAYYSAFSNDDNVLLIIKTNTPGRNPEQATAIIEGICSDLKKSLRRFSQESMYPKVAILTGHMPESHINGLHNTGDVFVSSSHGESFCLPYVDAVGFGKPTIVPKHTSFLDYGFDSELAVESADTTVLGVDNAPNGLYTADETWGNTSLADLTSKMLLAYRNIEIFQKPEAVAARKKFVKDRFSRKAIGNQFKNLLNAK